MSPVQCRPVGQSSVILDDVLLFSKRCAGRPLLRRGVNLLKNDYVLLFLISHAIVHVSAYVHTDGSRGALGLS